MQRLMISCTRRVYVLRLLLPNASLASGSPYIFFEASIGTGTPMKKIPSSVVVRLDVEPDTTNGAQPSYECQFTNDTLIGPEEDR